MKKVMIDDLKRSTYGILALYRFDKGVFNASSISATEVEVLPSEDEQASDIGDEVSEYYPEGG